MIIANASEIKRIGKLVSTNGSFDLMHSGHLQTLHSAKEMGDVLVVLVNSDLSIKRNKGEKRPIINQEERMLMLDAIKWVDYVLLFDEDTPLRVLEEIKSDVHVKGGSYLPERIKEEKELIESFGGKHVCLDLKEGLSTTKIIERIVKLFKD